MMRIQEKYKSHAERVAIAGGRLYIVGGAVRDFLLKRESSDVDLCVTGLTVEQFLNIFPNARLQGKAFPVFVVDEAEIALARIERKCRAGHKGFDIISTPDITIEQDLERRDLTINSIAIDLLTGSFVDPYGGRRDIEEGIVRPTSIAFLEDPVRALRAARFVSELNFCVSTSLFTAIRSLKPELHTINENLKFSEFKKAMMGKAPCKFIEVLRQSGVLDVTFPEFHRMDGMQQLNHSDGDALQHTYCVIEKCRQLSDDPYLVIAAAYHDVGKGTTPDDILPHHHAHEIRSVDIIDSLTWMPNDYKKIAKQIAYDHMRAHSYRVMKRGAKVKMLLRQNNTIRGLKGFTTVVYSDRPTLETLHDIAAMHSDLQAILSISGKDMPENTPKGEVFGLRLHERRCGLIGRTRPKKQAV